MIRPIRISISVSSFRFGPGRSATFSSRARLKLINHSRGVRPEIYELFEATYFTGLRKAGMPEE